MHIDGLPSDHADAFEFIVGEFRRLTRGDFLEGGVIEFHCGFGGVWHFARLLHLTEIEFENQDKEGMDEELQKRG